MPNGRLKAWWWRRLDEVLALVKGKTPALVIDEETVNDTFFDLLCIESFQKVLYTPSLIPHPLLTEKAIQMGMGLKCLNYQEINTIVVNCAQLKPCDFLLVTEGAIPQDRVTEGEHHLKIALRPSKIQEALELGINPQDILLICHSPFELSQKELDHPLGGLYLRLRRGQLSHILDKIGTLNHASLLVLSGSGSFCIDPETGTLDISSTRAWLERIAQALPNHTLWLDPEGSILTDAIALFVTAAEVRRHGDDTYAMVDLDRSCTSSLTSEEGPHLVFNLTHPQKPVRIASRLLVSESIPCPAETHPGDLLVITNTWEMALSNTRSKLHLHYLKARRICQVRL